MFLNQSFNFVLVIMSRMHSKRDVKEKLFNRFQLPIGCGISGSLISRELKYLHKFKKLGDF